MTRTPSGLPSESVGVIPTDIPSIAAAGVKPEVLFWFQKGNVLGLGGRKLV